MVKESVGTLNPPSMLEGPLLPRLVRALLRSRRAGSGFLNNNELTILEMIVLYGIEHNKPDAQDNVFASELQSELFISKAAVSQMLSSLERQGLITRLVNEGNRRKIDILLTEKGRAAMEKQKVFLLGAAAELTDAFGEGKLLEMISLFDEFSAVVEQVVERRTAATQEMELATR